MAATSRLQGYEDGFFIGPHLFDRVTPEMEIYRQEIFGPVLSPGARGQLRGGAGACDGPRIRQRHRDLHPRRRHRAGFRQPDQYRHGGDQRADPGAAGLSHLRRLEEIGLRRSEPARARRLPLLHQDQDRDGALAERASRKAASSTSMDAVRCDMPWLISGCRRTPTAADMCGSASKWDRAGRVARLGRHVAAITFPARSGRTGRGCGQSASRPDQIPRADLRPAWPGRAPRQSPAARRARSRARARERPAATDRRM
jgi:hypothetical protein